MTLIAIVNRQRAWIWGRR